MASARPVLRVSATAALLYASAACQTTGPSQTSAFNGSWIGSLKYVGCRQSDRCVPKACYWEAEYAYHMPATLMLTLRQSGSSATADLVVDEGESETRYRETGHLSGSVGDQLVVEGNGTRLLVGGSESSPFFRIDRRVRVFAAAPAPGALTGGLTRAERRSDTCHVSTQWSFTATPAGE